MTCVGIVEAPAACPLTRRELEAVRLLAEGLTYDQIAARRHVSTSTVRTHLCSAYAKLDVFDRAQAVLACMRAGWIEDDSALAVANGRLDRVGQICDRLEALDGPDPARLARILRHALSWRPESDSSTNGAG